MVDDIRNKKDKVADGTNEDFASMYLKNKNPVFIVNKKGKITEINDSFSKKIGVKKKNILGRDLSELNFLTDESKKKAKYRHISRLIGKEKPFYMLDIIDKKGNIQSAEIDTKPILKNGKVSGEIGFITKMEKIDSKETKKRNKKVKKEQMKENIELLNALEKLKQKDRELENIKSEMKENEKSLKTKDQDLDSLSGRWREKEEEIKKQQYQTRELSEQIERIQNKLFKREREIDELRENLRKNKNKLEEKK